MKTLKITAVLAIAFMAFNACDKDDCETCTQTIGGVAGNEVMEERVVCDKEEAESLEASSAGTTVWTCE